MKIPELTRKALQRRYFPRLAAILLLAFLLPSHAAAQNGVAAIRTEPAVLEVGEGQIETLLVLLANAQNVYGVDLQAAFDPAIVEVVDADPDHAGVQMTPGPFLQPDFVARNLADNETGILRYVVTQLNPTPPVNGEGVILSIQFLGKAAGAQTALTILAVQIADRRGAKQAVTASGAELLAVPPKPPTPTLAPTATFLPAAPTIPLPVLTRLPHTPRPAATAGQAAPPSAAPPGSASSAQTPVYVMAAGFSGSALLIGLSAWRLAARRRKERAK